jgi:hypothetical protein
MIRIKGTLGSQHSGVSPACRFAHAGYSLQAEKDGHRCAPPILPADGQQKPATDVSARAFGSCDDDHVPVICPTSQFFSASNWQNITAQKQTRPDGLDLV